MFIFRRVAVATRVVLIIADDDDDDDDWTRVSHYSDEMLRIK